jgi:hypothetical protein
VINDDAISGMEAAASGPGFDDLTGGLVAGNDSLIAFRPFAQVLVIDAADV